MQLTYRHNRFVAICAYDERQTAKDAGFRWDPRARHWWTDDATVASKFLDHADERAVARLADVSRAYKASAAVTVDEAAAANPLVRRIAAQLEARIAADAPRPYPFQIAGSALMAVSQRGSGILADDMGLGKTVQAILYVARILHETPSALVLVVCPAAVAPNWAREFDRWCNIKPAVITGRTRAPVLPKCGVMICPYSVVSADLVLSALRVHTFAALICDESHYLKTPAAARTKAVWNVLRPQAQHVWCLTGTPIPNRPREIAHIAAAIAPDVFKSEWDFLGRYCDPRLVWNGRRYVTTYDGADNLDELAQKLRGSIMIRRTKAQVLASLPRKRREIVVLSGGAAVRRLDLSGLDIATIRKQIDSGVVPMLPEISAVRHEEALARVASTVEWIVNELEQDDQPLCVLTHHKDVSRAIADGCLDADHLPVYADGDTSPEQRQAHVDAFANGTGRLFIGTIGACGTGINGLQRRATKVIMAEASWTPGDNEQAEDRVCRIGAVANDFVRVTYLVTDGGIDSYVMDVVLSKMESIRTIMADADAATTSHPRS
jgi:SWI/SNF-related matrix-associated actin-dependent regulator 1 of chromatin subfamily A